jgi:hypothetical protein
MNIVGKSVLATLFMLLMFSLNGLAQKNNVPIAGATYDLTANERLALSGLRSIIAAQNTFLLTEGGGKSYAALNQLGMSGKIDAGLATGTKDGYLFFVATKAAEKETPPTYEVTAVPLSYGKTGRKSFYAKSTDLIRFADHKGKPATENDPIFDEQSEADAIAAVKSIIAAQITYFSVQGENHRYGTLEELGELKLIDSYLATGDRHGYSFAVNTQGKTDEREAAYQLFAIPIGINTAGLRAFYANQNGTIHYRNKVAELATSQDPILDDPSETDAIGVMRILMSSQSTYFSTAGENRRYGTLAQLSEAGLIDKIVAGGTRWGYRFFVRMPQNAYSEFQPTYQIYAVPVNYSATTKRSFFGDHTGVLRGADKKGMAATATDPPVVR